MPEQCWIRLFVLVSILQQLPQMILQQPHFTEAWMIPTTSTTTIRVNTQCSFKQSDVPGMKFAMRRSHHHPQQHPQILHMAGFGDAASSANESKEVKLKPKQQWDRYTTLKKEASVVVGVKIVTSTAERNGQNEDWLVVGAVKSDAAIPTDVAVARQRALLVEHAKRLYPLQISPKAQIEWGYVINDETMTSNITEENGESIGSHRWVTVDKTVLDSIPVKGIEKQMGFVGTPDPTTGFYCVYNEGRLVKATDSSSAATRPSSKKIG